MSFEHRFGVGIGGSYEDPYIHPCCESCSDSTYSKCPRTQELIEKCMILYQSSEVNRNDRG